jgi:hypothetical protein
LFRRAGVQITSVLGLQSVNTWAATEALQKGVPEGIDATAIAPYFGGNVTADDQQAGQAASQGVRYVLDQCQHDLAARRKDIRTHRELAGRHGLKLLAYEGGQHLVAAGAHRNNRQLVDVLVAANRHPDMYAIYRDYLDMWRQESGDGLMCLFNSVSEFGEYGSWGLMEYEGQPLDEAPKLRAALDFLKAGSSERGRRQTD